MTFTTWHIKLPQTYTDYTPKIYFLNEIIHVIIVISSIRNCTSLAYVIKGDFTSLAHIIKGAFTSLAYIIKDDFTSLA